MANSTLLCFVNWILQKRASLFSQTALFFRGLVAYVFCLLLCSNLAPLLTTNFLGQRTVRVKALQLALQTISAALVPPTHMYNGVLGLPGRTASHIELSLHMNRSAEHGLLLDTDF